MRQGLHSYVWMALFDIEKWVKSQTSVLLLVSAAISGTSKGKDNGNGNDNKRRIGWGYTIGAASHIVQLHMTPYWPRWLLSNVLAP